MISEAELMELSYPDAPKIAGTIPGPKGKAIWDESARYETPTRVGGSYFQVVWQEALGATVKDADGNIFIDMIDALDLLSGTWLAASMGGALEKHLMHYRLSAPCSAADAMGFQVCLTRMSAFRRLGPSKPAVRYVCKTSTPAVPFAQKAGFP